MTVRLISASSCGRQRDQDEPTMRIIETSRLSAAAAIATLTTIMLSLLLQGCAASPSDSLEAEAAAPSCAAGEIMVCDTRSSGRISDGRYGRRDVGGGRRRHCACQPERDLEKLEGPSLPAPH
jgi:hypothetical protein